MQLFHCTFVGINVDLCDFLFQQVVLKPEEFASINFNSYAKGLYLFFMPSCWCCSPLNDVYVCVVGL